MMKKKADAINQVIDKGVERTKSYWTPTHLSVFSEYKDITIPFSDFTRERGFQHKRGAKIADILGCIRSYSPFQHLAKEKGELVGTQLLDDVANEITAILNEGREKPMTLEEIQDYEFTATFDYFVLMARV